ncbi:MAG: hypothetical protein ABI707_08300 [Ferruginibacter sp.]
MENHLFYFISISSLPVFSTAYFSSSTNAPHFILRNKGNIPAVYIAVDGYPLMSLKPTYADYQPGLQLRISKQVESGY